MKRNRHGETKVWHDPLVSHGVRRQNAPFSGSSPQGSPSASEEAGARRREQGRRNGARIVAATRSADPRELERERLLERILAAAGRPPITKATEAYLAAGFELPEGSQEVWLQLLEHNDEGRVQQAIDRLTAILEDEEPKRRAVLESRLRSIEELADERATRLTAASLRRMISGK